ncbi:hypothetical protein HPP92_017068 [Vanilla planifolia]|uniref:Uncharacterized protein n=1 Tax=Vanilla planifolia TaxID=51239 RepID=A0A835QF94_VANPL|nr:hypothetical protein HPP92_017068 [Vanilla planifolia]
MEVMPKVASNVMPTSLSFFCSQGFFAEIYSTFEGHQLLEEDLVLSIHSIEGTDSGIDTYFGFCTYPGREQRHRIDLKDAPRPQVLKCPE